MLCPPPKPSEVLDGAGLPSQRPESRMPIQRAQRALTVDYHTTNSVGCCQALSVAGPIPCGYLNDESA